MKDKLTDQMTNQRYNGTRERPGWIALERSLRKLSEDGFAKILKYGPSEFVIHVFDADEKCAFEFRNAWFKLEEEDVDLFLGMQRRFAPVPPLIDGTVADGLAAWFNSGMGVTTAP